MRPKPARWVRCVAASLTPCWYQRFLELQRALKLSRADTVRAAIEALWNAQQPQKPAEQPPRGQSRSEWECGEA